MNRNLSIFSALVITFSGFLMASCHKRTEGVDSPATRIIGVWKETQYATDDNQNGSGYMSQHRIT